MLSDNSFRCTVFGDYKLPDGWVGEELDWSPEHVVFHAPKNGFMVTVDFKARCFRLGASTVGSPDSAKHGYGPYRGDGWRERLCADAVRFLSESCGIDVGRPRAAVRRGGSIGSAVAGSFGLMRRASGSSGSPPLGA